MKTLSKNKVKKFKEKLYHQRVSKLLRQGGKGLKPLGKYKKDEKGRSLVPTKKISFFFFQEISRDGMPYPDQYIDGLYTLFTILSKDAEPIAFDCGFSISEEDIQQAGNKKVIELLATNIIITYFNNLKTPEGKVDLKLLETDLSSVIEKSNAGRDYKSLVGKVLKGLVSSLAEDKPWRDYLDDINEADLICRLTGASLPSMEKKTLAGIIAKSRDEIQSYNDVFTKVLATREQMTAEETNRKKLLKAMERMDEAILTVLKKIDTYLASAERFITIAKLSSQMLLGKTDKQLKLNLMQLLFGARPGREAEANLLEDLGIAAARYRLNMLFDYPAVTRYCRAFKTEEPYQRLYYDLFRVLFNALADKMGHLDGESSDTDIRMLHQHLVETERAVDRLRLAPPEVAEEKQAVREAYAAIVHRIGFERLGNIMESREEVCQATQDLSREVMADLRTALVAACFSTLTQYAEQPLPADRATNGIKKRLHAYAVFYKPQREFYKNFFNIYVGSKEAPISSHLAGIVKKNKAFSIALLMVLSDEKTMKELLPDTYTGHARELLTKLRNKT